MIKKSTKIKKQLIKYCNFHKLVNSEYHQCKTKTLSKNTSIQSEIILIKKVFIGLLIHTTPKVKYSISLIQTNLLLKNTEMVFILDNFKIIKNMGMVSFFILMVNFIKENSKMISRMDKDINSFLMVQNIKVILKMELNQVKVSSNGPTVKYIKDNGLMVRNMVVEYGKAIKVKVTLENGKMEKLKVLEYTFQN